MRTLIITLLGTALLLIGSGCDEVYYTGEGPDLYGITPDFQYSLTGCEHVVVEVDQNGLDQCGTPVVTFGNRNAAVLESFDGGGEVVVQGQSDKYWEVRCNMFDPIELATDAINVITPPGPVFGGEVDVQVACEDGITLASNAYTYPDGRITADGRDLHQDEVSGLALMWSDGPYINVPWAYGYGFVHEQPVPRQSIFLAGDHDAVATREGIKPQTPPAAFELPEGSDRLRIGDTIELYHKRNHAEEQPDGSFDCDEPVCTYTGTLNAIQDNDIAYLAIEYERVSGEPCYAGSFGVDESTGADVSDEPTCDDGIDNDEDGLVDENDPSCGYYWGSGDTTDDAPFGCTRYYRIHPDIYQGLDAAGNVIDANELPLDFSYLGVMLTAGSPKYETSVDFAEDEDATHPVGIELPSGAYRARLTRGMKNTDIVGLPFDPLDPFEHELEFFDALEIVQGATSVMLPEEVVFPYYFDSDVRYYENFDTGGENTVPQSKELFVRAEGGASYGYVVEGFDTDADGDGVVDPWEYTVTVPMSEEGEVTNQYQYGFPWVFGLYSMFPLYIDPAEYADQSMSSNDWETFNDGDVFTVSGAINPTVENACKGIPVFWENDCGERSGDQDSCFDGQDNDGDDMVDDADSDCLCKDDFMTAVIEVWEFGIPYAGLGIKTSYRLVAHAWNYEERMCLPAESLALLPDVSPTIGGDYIEAYKTSGYGQISLNVHRMNPIPIEELRGNMVVDAQHGYSSVFFTMSNCEDGIDNDGDGLTDCDDWACVESVACTDKDPLDLLFNDPDGLDRYYYFWETDPDPLCDDGLDNDGDGWVDYIADDPDTEDVDESHWGDPGCDNAEDTSEGNDDLGPCADGVDNDGDGAIDGADPECADPTGDGWNSVSENPQCSNGVDDDGDGLTDYPDDPDCVDADDNLELMTGCEDGVDNDGDGWVDDEDPDCYYYDGTDEVGDPVFLWDCANMEDDDGDGLVDGLDPGCLTAEDDSEVDPPASCMDGVDNDGDGWTDFDDPTCADDNAEDPGGAPGPQECHDGLDNDGDGFIDGFDPNCGDAYDEAEEAVGCENGLDDDGDGWTDTEDPDCWYWGATDEMGLAGPYECGDNTDNDGDGVIDGLDPGCENSEDDDETDPEASCIDGLDNDADGWFDFDDPDCDGGAEDQGGFGSTECNDGTDNDGDGFTDADDPQCLDAYGDQEEEPTCSDGIDNDEDCWVDADDPDCGFYGSDFEAGQTLSAECGNHVDDDGDGLIDGCDPDCTDMFDTSE